MARTHDTSADSKDTDGWRAAMQARDTRATDPLLDVFAALWQHSSDDHPLTPDEIIMLLEHDNRQNSFYEVPSRQTVVNQLHYLEYTRILGREVRRADGDDESGDAEGGDDDRWYMAPVLSASEVRLLEDGLMLSRIDPQELQGVVSGLHQLAGGSAPSEELPYVSVDGYEHINGEFLATVEKITRAMQRNTAVIFSYCDYDEHGNLVKRLQRRDDEHQGDPHHDNKPRRYLLDPYNMVYKKGRYYLLGHFHDNPVPEGIEQDEKSTNLSCFTVDRIRDLQITTMPIAVPASTWDENGLPRKLTKAPRFDAITFARQRPHITMGTLLDVVMSIGPGALTSVYEWFDDPQVERIDGPFDPSAEDAKDANGKAFHYRVTVRSPRLSIIWWALQYAFSQVRIESPQSVRDELRNAGALLTQRYGGK